MTVFSVPETKLVSGRFIRGLIRPAQRMTSEPWRQQARTTEDLTAQLSTKGDYALPGDDKTIERDLALAPGMSSVGPTASLRSQEDARPARTTRSFGADGASDDGVDSASDDGVNSQ